MAKLEELVIKDIESQLKRLESIKFRDPNIRAQRVKRLKRLWAKMILNEKTTFPREELWTH
jgi:hypothetical protein